MQIFTGVSYSERIVIPIRLGAKIITAIVLKVGDDEECVKIVDSALAKLSTSNRLPIQWATALDTLFQHTALRPKTFAEIAGSFSRALNNLFK